MLILKNLKLKNFLSHHSSEIEFEDNVKMSIEGVSGSGKSSIVEGILWCFFGKGRADNRSMIKRGEDRGSVTVEMMDGEDLYKITREVSAKGKQTLDIEKKIGILDWEPVSKTGLKDAQDYVEKELLKSSYLLFINSVVYPQDNVESFVKQTAAKRKELLLEIVGAESYDLFYNRAKSAISLSSEVISRLAIELDSLRRSHTDNVGEAAKLKFYISNEIDLLEKLKDIKFEEEKTSVVKEALYSVNSKYLTLNLQVENKQTALKGLNTRKEKLIYSDQNAAPQMSEMDIDLKLAELDHLEAQISAIASAEKDEITRKGQMYAVMSSKPQEIDFDAEIASLTAQKERIEGSTDTFCSELGKACPSLQRQVNESTQYYKDQIEAKTVSQIMQQGAMLDYVARLEDVGPEIVYDQRQLEVLRIQASSLTKYRTEKERIKMVAELRANMDIELAGIESEIVAITSEILALVAERAEVITQKAEIERLLVDVKDYAVEINRLQVAVNANSVSKSLAQQAADKISVLDAQIIEKSEKQHAETDKMEELLLVKDAFGATGIKSVVVDYILPGLEEKINETLGKLSSFKITLDTQRKSLTDEKMIEGLFINIYNDQGEVFDYDSYSGGQKNRVAYALFEGLASIQKCNFRIFDESIAGLDNETISAFADVMLQLNQEDRQVLCVSHIQEIKDIFPEKINIVNVNGESKII